MWPARSASGSRPSIAPNTTFSIGIKGTNSDWGWRTKTSADLATKMTIARPQLQVLLMFGFPEGMLVLNEGWHSIAKPFITLQMKALIPEATRIWANNVAAKPTVVGSPGQDSEDERNYTIALSPRH
jgi:hypothetical protein